jgi:hypothetical protein
MSVSMDAACSAALTLEPCSDFRDNVIQPARQSDEAYTAHY